MKSAWDPKGIAVISLFFSFIPAGILHAINYKKLGRATEAKLAVFTVVLPLILLIIIRIYLSNLGLSVFLLYDVLISYFFYSSQKNLFNNFITKGGKKESIFKPVLFSGLFLIISIGILLLIDKRQFDRYGDKLEKANYYSDNGQYSNAEKLFKELLEQDPNQPAVYYNLAILYERQGKHDLAKQQLKKLLEIDPTDQEARDYLEEFSNK